MSVTWKFAWIAKKLILIGSFNIQGLKLLAWIRFTFKLPLMKGSEITTLFWPPVDFGKKINSFRSSHRKVFYKMELHSSRICKIAGFQPLATAAMWTILDTAGFLDPPLEFKYRKSNGYFDFSAISVYKVYIDFRIKILGRLFVNDK